MTLRDLSHLPRSGHPPSGSPRLVDVLVTKWHREAIERGPKPTAHDTRIRHSDAGKCARAIAYRAAGIPESDPMDLAGTWVTGIGTLLHEAWQEALVACFPDAEIEPRCRIEGLDASGHCDAVITETRPDDTTWKTLVELKTTGGYSYKKKVGERGPAEGPSYEHRAQAALNALAVGADEMVIAYLATEAISRRVAANKGIDELTRFGAEWSYIRSEYEPWARHEQARMDGILRLLDEEGLLAARKFPVPELPPGAEIIDPASGTWHVDRDGLTVDLGTWWACSYCPWQQTCAGTPAGRIPLEEVTS